MSFWKKEVKFSGKSEKYLRKTVEGVELFCNFWYNVYII